MAHGIVSTGSAPKAIGPYSQAVEARAGRMIFCSGQIPLDPQTGEIVSQDVVAQAAQRLSRTAGDLELVKP